jgi:hypothetical protein
MSSDPTPPVRISSARLWGLALAAGLAAGFASWYGGEKVAEVFKPGLHVVREHGIEAMRPSTEEQHGADLKNAAMAFSILGGILGLFLGAAGGFVRGRWADALKAGAVGLVLGTAVGAGASAAVVPVYLRVYDPLWDNLIPPLLAHGAIWSTIGAMAGLAFGIGLGGRAAAVRCLIGGFLGGFLGAAAFDTIAVGAFPFDRTFQPISLSSSSRMVARLCVTLFTAVGVVIATRVKARKAGTPGHESRVPS